MRQSAKQACRKTAIPYQIARRFPSGPWCSRSNRQGSKIENSPPREHFPCSVGDAPGLICQPCPRSIPRKINTPSPRWFSFDSPLSHKSFASHPSHVSHLDANHARSLRQEWDITALYQPFETETLPATGFTCLIERQNLSSILEKRAGRIYRVPSSAPNIFPFRVPGPCFWLGCPVNVA
jgi:hypothetical protein